MSWNDPCSKCGERRCECECSKIEYKNLIEGSTKTNLKSVCTIPKEKVLPPPPAVPKNRKSKIWS